MATLLILLTLGIFKIPFLSASFCSIKKLIAHGNFINDNYHSEAVAVELIWSKVSKLSVKKMIL